MNQDCEFSMIYIVTAYYTHTFSAVRFKKVLLLLMVLTSCLLLNAFSTRVWPHGNAQQ